ncbi:MAG: class I SAM-dependent methyltransferase, partial [Rhodospirillales bacterium]|nr:class I SAM-dependent methyltransferase [Rhodospirillales bacterium]
GEALPFAPEAADGVVYLFSLHHVPVPLQADALFEAARVLISGGSLYVVEPLCSGSHFELLRPLDDETEVRQATARTLERALDFGFVEESRHEYLYEERLADFDDFLHRAICADSMRMARFPSVEWTVRSAFERLARHEYGAYVFEQPCRAYLFRKT